MIISARREQSDGMNKLNLILTIPPSVNHCYKNFNAMIDAGTVCLRHWQEPGRKRRIILLMLWHIGNTGACLNRKKPDDRRRDMNNTHKLLCDALEGALYLDDKMVLVRDMDFAIDRKRPRLEVCVHVKDD